MVEKYSIYQKSIPSGENREFLNMQWQTDPQSHKNQSRNNGAMVPRAELLNSYPGKAKAFVLYPANLYPKPTVKEARTYM
jgi:hypothetical protein